MKTKHEFKAGKKTVIIEIEEKSDRVDVTWKLPDGRPTQEELSGIQEMATALVQKYDSDPRPLHIVHPLTGEHAFVYGDRDNGFGVVVPGNYKEN